MSHKELIFALAETGEIYGSRRDSRIWATPAANDQLREEGIIEGGVRVGGNAPINHTVLIQNLGEEGVAELKRKLQTSSPATGRA